MKNLTLLLLILCTICIGPIPAQVGKNPSSTSTTVGDNLGDAEVAEKCPEPMTRAELLALLNSSSLDIHCHYVLTDYNRGTVGAATILLHATAPDALSIDAKVTTTFDNLAWVGRYDIGTGRLEYLADNLGNEVTARASVDAFPWGVAAVINNRVNNAIINYTAGAMTDNDIRSGATVAVGGATFRRNVIGQQANVTQTAGDFVENVVDTDATVVTSTTGDCDNNHFESSSVSNISGVTNVDRVRIGKAANFTVSGGTVSDTQLDLDATVTFTSGSNYENYFGSSVIYTQAGTGYIRQSRVEGNSTLINGDVNILLSRFFYATYNTTGSTGTVANSDFRNVNVTAMQNIPTLYLQYCDFSSYSSISATGATRLYLRFVSAHSYGRVLASAGVDLAANYTGIRDFSYIQCLQGTLLANYSSLGGGSYLQHDTPGSNNVDRATVNSNGRVRFLEDSTGCRIYYCVIQSGSNIECRGASTGCYFYSCTASAASSLYCDDCVNGRYYYCAGFASSTMYASANTDTHYLYYCFANSRGNIQILGGAGGGMYAVSSSTQSIARLVSPTANSRFYYSSVEDYYYLYLTLTTSRTGLHATGRRTYTVTDPVNGTYTQNF